MAALLGDVAQRMAERQYMDYMSQIGAYVPQRQDYEQRSRSTLPNIPTAPSFSLKELAYLIEQGLVKPNNLQAYASSYGSEPGTTSYNSAFKY